SPAFSLQEGLPMIIDEGSRVGCEAFIGVFVYGDAAVGGDLREVLFSICPDEVDGAEGIVPVGPRPSVEAGKHRAYLIEAAIGELALLYDLGKKPLFRYALHLDRVLDDHP